MATITKRKMSDHTSHYRVQIRRKGKPYLSMTFSSLHEAYEWVKQNEFKYINTEEDYAQFKKNSQIILNRHIEMKENT